MLSIHGSNSRFALLLLILVSVRAAQAATLPAGFTEAQFGGAGANMTSPTAMAFAPDGRLFVCQQGGSLRVIKNGVLLAAPFLTLAVNSSGERGLLGVAFDPNFAANQFVYVYYTTASAPIHNRVSRFTANGDVAAGGETILFELDNLSGATNHNGGALHFGPDGKLYVAVGENANAANSQSLANVLGKMLRLNADGSIPADNPFFNQTTGNNRAIWALGLRNPFTFNFQPGTGRLFINDVGQVTWEEINDGIAGSNYGWPNCEGACPAPNPNFRDPLHQYLNDASTCAITGGTFYNPAVQSFPALYVGKYFFADFCAGFIRYFDPAGITVAGFATGLSLPVDLQVGPDGGLYYLQRGGGGQVWRVQFTGSQAPMITQHPTNVNVFVGQPATFTVAASGTEPLNYQWQRNGADIAGANGASYTIPATTLGDHGAQFRCVVTNGFGNAASNAATLTVTNNQPPTATITQPAAGTLYSGGQLISYAGTGTDPEQGTLPASAFTWEVVFHHDTHTHPFIAPLSGTTGGGFIIPTAGETAANVWYRIRLTVTDGGGMMHTVFRDVNPRTATITLQSNPPGLQLTLDGQPVTTPLAVLGVVGIERMLGAVSPQNVGGVNYVFTSWSDGGAAAHTISTPVADTAYTAMFANGLVFHPLPRPLRLLDTRANSGPCDLVATPIAAGGTFTAQARLTCDGITIPATAQAVVGNVTVINQSAQFGFLTLFPAGQPLPLAANMIYEPGQLLSNNFTVGLNGNGEFSLFGERSIHVVVDVSGYFAPPGADGLYYHALPRPLRLLDTRAGQGPCDNVATPIAAGGTFTAQARLSCDGITIPATAAAIVGNATVINQSAQFGFLTLYPAGQSLPLAANMIYAPGQLLSNAFTVGLNANGEFSVFGERSLHLVIDVAGYYSPEANDANGPGLLFNPLPRPLRLLDTRAGQGPCDNVSAPIAAGTAFTAQARVTCDGITIPTAAQTVSGNVTAINQTAQFGFLTLYPAGQSLPLAANMIYAPGQLLSNAFTVGLNANGEFSLFGERTIHVVVDVSGYFAP